MATNLQPINAKFESSLDKCRRVRWRGSNGGWQLGWLVFVEEGDGARDLFVVFNEHNRTVVRLIEGQFEYDLPKDDHGNPKPTE